jgi:hypothetical protein
MKTLVLSVMLVLQMHTGQAFSIERKDSENCISNCYYTLSVSGITTDVRWKADAILELRSTKTDDEPVRMAILGDGYMLYKETFRKKGDTYKTYDLQKFPPGTYTIRIQKGSELVEKTIRKESPGTED